MLFSSLEFLYLFLPASLLLYFLCPFRWRNSVLLAVSLIFYGSGEPRYLFLMVTTVVADYAFGLWLGYSIRRGGKPKSILVTAVVFNLALLGFFKYYDFFASILSFEPLGLTLPIGISFYTFQALSYVIDVYRREVAAQRDPIAFGTYVALFPQLIAGPIVRYCEIDAQLKQRSHSLSRIADGIATFCVGLSKKVLLANPAGAIKDFWLAQEGSGTVLGAWLWLIFYAFQIYFDFSGYSDMAIGLGRILGFDFSENFRYPYTSRSITEFWRRWHITLSSWFREYVYIPLGGNRTGRWRTYRNLLITWTLTGFWHGASWNFLLWGLYFFFLLAIEKAFLGKYLERVMAPVRHAYALFFILLGWLIFASDGSLALSGGALLARLFGVGVDGFANGWITYELWRNLSFLLLMALGATPLPKRLYVKACESKPTAMRAVRNLLCLASLVICTAYLVDSGYNPFLYFRF